MERLSDPVRPPLVAGLALAWLGLAGHYAVPGDSSWPEDSEMAVTIGLDDRVLEDIAVDPPNM